MGIQRVFIVGNIAGGKTLLARRLSKELDLPITHVDTLQFLPGMIIRPLDETRSALNKVIEQNRWIIDGYGPLDLLEKRFKAADKIVFVDLPLARHYLWVIKRQIKSLWKKREELPEGCNEVTFKHTVKIFKTLQGMHTKMRPELTRILTRKDLQDKLVWIRTVDQLDSLELKTSAPSASNHGTDGK